MALRFVLDTNVLISGMLSNAGPPRQLIDAWIENQYTMITSRYQIAELHHVLTYPRIVRRVRMTEAELAAILHVLTELAIVVADEPSLVGVTRDPKDDAILACAVGGRADYLVSGDQDLLVLGRFRDVAIISPRDALKLVPAL